MKKADSGHNVVDNRERRRGKRKGTGREEREETGRGSAEGRMGRNGPRAF